MQRCSSGSLAAVGKAAVAIECETEMRSQRSDGRFLLRIRIGIGCGNDDDPEPAAILATRWQHRCSQCIALPVAQREEKRHLSLYMGLEADVALDRVGPLRTPGLDCLLPLAAEIFLRSEEHTSELQSHSDLVCRLLLEKKKLARLALRCVRGRFQLDRLVRFTQKF